MCLLEENIHPILSGVLMEGGCQAIDKLASDVSVCVCVLQVLTLHTFVPYSRITAMWRTF